MATLQPGLGTELHTVQGSQYSLVCERAASGLGGVLSALLISAAHTSSSRAVLQRSAHPESTVHTVHGAVQKQNALS